MYAKKDFNKIKTIILKHIKNVEKIVLFGSYARNEEKKDSDIDILILTKSPLKRKEKLEALTKIRWDVAMLGYKADFLLKDVSDYIKEVDKPTLSKIINKEGKLLWEAS